MKQRAFLLPLAILVGAAVLSAGAFSSGKLLAQSSAPSIVWSQSAGNGTVFPACGSASSGVTCNADGSASVTVSWNIQESHSGGTGTCASGIGGGGDSCAACEAATIYLGGSLWITGQPCAGSATYNGLAPNTYYSCQAQGYAASTGNSSDLDDCSFTTPNCAPPPPPPPAAPSNLQASCTGTTGSISWSPVSGATDYQARFYIPTADPCPSGWTDYGTGAWSGRMCYTPTTSTAVGATLIAGHSYIGGVYAHNGSGWSGETDSPTFSCPGNTGMCPDGSAAPQSDSTLCTCAQGNTNACARCPDGSPAPSGNTAQCTCAHGNTNACSTASCPDGSAPPQAGNSASCTCQQGNQAACSSGNPNGGGGSCTSPYSCTPPSPPGPGCVMAAAPTTANPGDSVVIGWASACDGASAGCTQGVLGFQVPVTAGGTTMDHGIGAVNPSTNGSPITVTPTSLPATYTLSGQLYSGFWPILLPVSGSQYSCQVTIAQATVQPLNGCMLQSSSCSADGSSILYTYSGTSVGGASCPDQSILCPYAGSGYGCVSASGSAYCAIPPKPVGSFHVSPTLIKSATPVKLTWQIGTNTTCDISATDGEHWDGLTASGSAMTTPLTGQVIFHMNCSQDITSEELPTQTIVVNLVPIFHE